MKQFKHGFNVMHLNNEYNKYILVSPVTTHKDTVVDLSWLLTALTVIV